MDKLYVASFETNRVYFADGILPGPPEEEKEKYSFINLYDHPDYTLLSVYLDNKIIGCGRVKHLGNYENEIEFFFIDPDYHGKNVGSIALAEIEKHFPDTKLWRLATPTQAMKNIVFYVNKGGYHIVKVKEYNRDTNSGIYIFEKRI